jgi:hypothetical protein
MAFIIDLHFFFCQNDGKHDRIFRRVFWSESRGRLVLETRLSSEIIPALLQNAKISPRSIAYRKKPTAKVRIFNAKQTI